MGSVDTEGVRVGRGRSFAYAVAALGRILAAVIIVALLVTPIGMVVTNTDQHIASAGALGDRRYAPPAWITSTTPQPRFELPHLQRDGR